VVRVSDVGGWPPLPVARLDAGVVGSGKDIGKDKPAFGWELEPFVAFGSISGNASSGKY